MGLALVFLDKLLLADTSMPVANFDWTSLVDRENRHGKLNAQAQKTNMIIDAQAIEHLDILP